VQTSLLSCGVCALPLDLLVSKPAPSAPAPPQVLQYMAFPLLRPELQALPYLTAPLTRLVLDIAKSEAVGLRPILTGPLGTRKLDLVTAENNLNDSLPKLVVKTYVAAAVEKPFTWRLLGFVLRDRLANAAPETMANLPELRNMSGKEMAEYGWDCWASLSEVLHAIAFEEETSSLSEVSTGSKAGW
jgi:hypothetical protein